MCYNTYQEIALRLRKDENKGDPRMVYTYRNSWKSQYHTLAADVKRDIQIFCKKYENPLEKKLHQTTLNSNSQSSKRNEFKTLKVGAVIKAPEQYSPAQGIKNPPYKKQKTG